MQEYTNKQQQISFGLLQSGMDYDTIKNALAVLGTNAFISQQKVYNNLTELVSSGITMNAAQRAFLDAASEQVNLGFRSNNDSLNRLIQLQQADLSEARIAQMAGLKQFLEQNYQNSQYIKEGFASVSSKLVEMQSLVGAQIAMSTEKSIQTYLGSFQSAGGSAGLSIADAIGKLGAGDFELGNMQNLMVMAASRAGLSYADLLTNGLDANKSNQLLTSMFTYLANMSNMGGGSNVAMHEIAKIFGVNVSDIRAAQNMNLSPGITDYDTSITSFLSDLAGTSTPATRLNM